MPLVLDISWHPPEHRYMIFTFMNPDRCMVIFISGVCSVAECRSFINECDAYTMVEARTFFDSGVEVKSAGFTITGETPTILKHFGDAFASVDFVDPYTLYVARYTLSKFAHGSSY